MWVLNNLKLDIAVEYLIMKALIHNIKKKSIF